MPEESKRGGGILHVDDQLDVLIREQRVLISLERQQLDVLKQIRASLIPRPATLQIQTIGVYMPLEVGATAVATVKVLDQNQAEMPDYDFVSNPPTWSTSDSALATVADNTGTPELNDALLTGVAEGTGVVLSVAVANLTAELTFDVVAAGGGGTPVASSLSISVEPPLDGSGGSGGGPGGGKSAPRGQHTSKRGRKPGKTKQVKKPKAKKPDLFLGMRGKSSKRRRK